MYAAAVRSHFVTLHCGAGVYVQKKEKFHQVIVNIECIMSMTILVYYLIVLL